ncbi:MAG: C10 family peptidase [Tepidisphaeraceae bacterium]|jgi:hypothetical protein
MLLNGIDGIVPIDSLATASSGNISQSNPDQLTLPQASVSLGASGSTIASQITNTTANLSNGLTSTTQQQRPPLTLSAPTDMHATANLVNEVDLSWNAVTGVKAYDVYRNTNSDVATATCIGTPSGTSYRDTSVTQGITYYYWVEADNGTGSVSAPAGPVMGSPANDTTSAGSTSEPPSVSPPTGTPAQSISPGIINVPLSPNSWTTPAGKGIGLTVSWQWWNGSIAPNAVETLVVGVRNSSGQWVTGTTPAALMSETPPVGAPDETWSWSFGLNVPTVPGTYSIVMGEEPAATNAAAIADFETGADAATATVGPLTVTPVSPGIINIPLSTTSWSTPAGNGIGLTVSWQWWNGSSAPNTVETLVVGVRNSSGQWVTGTTPAVLMSETPPVGAPDETWSWSFGLNVPTAPGTYSIVMGEEPAATNAAAIADFESGADAATATVGPLTVTPVLPGIINMPSSPTSWNAWSGASISGTVSWQWWNGSSAPNAVETLVVGVKDSSGHWVAGTTPAALMSETPPVGATDETWSWSFGLNVPTAPGTYSIVMGEEPAATNAAAIADFESGADAATATVGPLTVAWATPGVLVSGANPLAWSAATSSTISGSFTAQWWNGSATANIGQALVVGIFDGAGKWVGGTVPQVLSWQNPPIGTPGSTEALSFSDLSVPTTPGAYSVVIAEEPSSQAVQAFEASADTAAATIGTLTTVPSLTTWGPLLPFPTWNQGGLIAYGSSVNYNDYCPIDPATGMRSATGCVPTAITQIIYYWHYPLSISFGPGDAYISNAGTASAVNIDGDAATYDFPTLAALNSDLSSLQYNGNPTEEALLLFGIGVKMQASYSSSGTGAGYSSGSFGELGFQSADSSGDWAAIEPTVISNIEAGQPVLLGVPGHATVIDGYNSSTGEFHVVLGWGGSDDGWYALPGVGDFPGSTTPETPTFVVDNIEPILPVPTDVSASGALPGQINVSWDASEEATGYQVWRSLVDNPATASQISGDINATSFDDTSAVPGQTQYYWVKATSEVGTSGFSSVASSFCRIEAPGIVIVSASLASWTVSPGGTLGGTVTYQWWNGSNNPNAQESVVLGIRDSSGHWVVGTTPWVLASNIPPVGTPYSTWWYSFGGMGVPTTPGTYELVLAEESASTNAAAIADFESGADAATAIAGALTSFATPDPQPATPSNLTPAAAATNVLTLPTLNASAFSVTDGDTQIASQWRVMRASDGVIIYDSGTDLVDKTSQTLPAGILTYATAYNWQVRYEDSGGQWSNWSTATSFTTLDPAPATPTNLSPTSVACGVGANQLVASPFSAPDGDTMHASEWKLMLISSGTLVADWTDLGTSTSVPSTLLAYGTGYQWQVRYEDSGGLWSNWSIPTEFTTIDQIGSAWFSSGVGARYDITGLPGAAQTLEVTAGTIVLNADLSADYPNYTLKIENGARVVLASDQTVGNLNVISGGTLDIGKYEMIINYGTNSDPKTAILSNLRSGYNGGSWTGAGIDSSAAALSKGAYGVGFADGADGIVQGLSNGQIELKYTLNGDANLDGLVNGSDFNILAANFNQSAAGWDYGDFNYDGLVNAADFNELAANFNQGANLNAPGPVAGSGAIYTIAGSPGAQTLDILSGTVTLTSDLSALLPNYSLQIENGASVVLASDQHIGALQLVGSGSLDVNNYTMFINYGSNPDPISTIAAYIKSGYNGGGWNGPGIMSTAAQTRTNGLYYGLGYADGKDGVVSGLSSGQIEIKYTLLGDANLDGLVNGSDFNILAANFNQSITGWDQGDFNYDGLVNAADFNDLAANFNQGASGASVASSAAVLDVLATPVAATTPATVTTSTIKSTANTTSTKMSAAPAVVSEPPTVATVTTKSTAMASTAWKSKPVGVSTAVVTGTTNRKSKASTVTTYAASVVTIPTSGSTATSQNINNKDAKFLADR